jgi:hypothetical protein
VRLYKNYLIAACYDGNIYIFNTKNDDDAVNICGPSNMLLAMDLWDNKVMILRKILKKNNHDFFSVPDHCGDER